MTATMDEIVKLISLLYAEYCRCAELPVEVECYDKMVELGVLARIVDNFSELSKYQGLFDEAMECCGRAGKQSLKEAQGNGDQSITPEVFESAYHHVADVVSRARQAAGDPGEGPLC